MARTCNFRIRSHFVRLRRRPGVRRTLQSSDANSISHGRLVFHERVDRLSVNEANSPLCPFLRSNAYRSDSAFGKQFVELRSREARILHGPWDSKPSRGQCHGIAMSVQLDFSGKHERKITNRSASFSAVFSPAEIRYECLCASVSL
jgi:hypothetical protein